MRVYDRKLVSVDDLAADLERFRRRLILSLFVVFVLFILFEALRGRHYWNKVKGEGNLWNYGSSLIYFFVGELAILNAILADYRHRLRDPSRRTCIWMAWGAAGIAFAYFACDEMLQIHERMGLILQSFIPSLGHGPKGEGDGVIIAGFVAVGLVFSVLFARKLLVGRAAFRYFIAGLVLAIIVGLLEVLPRSLYINHLPFRETEELAEIFAGWALSSAFISSAAGTLTEILRSVREPERSITSARATAEV